MNVSVLTDIIYMYCLFVCLFEIFFGFFVIYLIFWDGGIIII